MKRREKQMTKTFLFSFLSLFVFNGVNAATSWWEQDTVCRINPSTCYTNMGIGYEPAFWDNTSKCWGQKYVCTDALSETYKQAHHPTDERIAMIRTDIKSPNISADFDTTVLNINDNCFGVRKTQGGGSKASVNGRFVRVWCNDILDDLNIDNEELENGKIISGPDATEPECDVLATHGYVAIENGKCYGRYYDESQYRIQCDGGVATLIVLNGSDGTTGSSDITTMVQANARFTEMLQNARNQHKTYFGE